MKSKTIIVVFSLLLAVNFSFGQDLSKEEMKSLKKELRELMKNPGTFNKMKKSIVSSTLTIENQSKDLMNLKVENAGFKNKMKYIQDSVNICKTIISEKDVLLAKKVELRDSTVISDKGLKFRIQIGKYKEMDMTSFFTSAKKLSFEKSSDGSFVYTIGNFATEYSAELFKSTIRDLGIKGAFVAYYKDGVRIAKD